jgi:uncharacterized protein YdeI (YjbR/CyaY-like superfamily)
MNSKVYIYFVDGCGRCPLVATPKCKVNTWKEELQHLRMIILNKTAIKNGLKEELKWGIPCYTFQGNNILILAAFKDFCSISFLKGVLLKDEKGILTKPGENSQSARQIRFTNVKEILKLESTIKAYINEAMELEKSGEKVEFKKINEFVIPEEFQTKLNKIPALKTAFKALTPGRQRGYLLYFSAPKQSKTRDSRIEKCLKQILNGKGLTDK